MKARAWWTALCWLAFAVMLALWATKAHAQPSPAAQAANGQCTVSWAYTQLYVRELTGRNDGPEVEAYQRVTGNHRGEAWCGSFQAAAQKACGLPFPAGAGGARNWFANAKRTYYVRGVRGSLNDLQVGDKVGHIYPPSTRIGHISMAVRAARAVRRGRPSRGFILRAGNTGSGGGRDGAGVRDVYYASPDLATAANWKY